MPNTMFEVLSTEADDVRTFSYRLSELIKEMTSKGWEVHQIDNSTASVPDGYGNQMPKFYGIVVLKKEAE